MSQYAVTSLWIIKYATKPYSRHQYEVLTNVDPRLLSTSTKSWSGPKNVANCLFFLLIFRLLNVNRVSLIRSNIYYVKAPVNWFECLSLTADTVIFPRIITVLHGVRRRSKFRTLSLMLSTMQAFKRVHLNAKFILMNSQSLWCGNLSYLHIQFHSV
jgi:hypothetical protein